MTYVIAQPCVDVLDTACIEECPVDCIYEGERMLYIHPDECVDCGACEPVCPVEAIFYEDDVPGAVEGLLQGQRRVLRRPRLARRRLQDRQDRQGPPARRRAAAAGGGRRALTRSPAEPLSRRPCRPSRCRGGCPTSPGTCSPPYGDRARAHPDGIVDLSVGTPVDPTPEVVQAALRGGRRRARLPARRTAPPQLREAAAGWLAPPAAARRSTRSTCCRRSARRSWSPGCRRSSGSGPATLVVVPELAYPTYEVGALARRAPTWCAPTALLALGPGAGWTWSGSTRRPTRPAGCCPPSTCARSSTGPASAARSSCRDECYLELGWDAPSRSRCCTPTSAAAATTGVLAVHSLSKRSNLAGYRAGFVAGDPRAGRRAAAGPQAPRADRARAGAGGDGGRARRRRARRRSSGPGMRARRERLLAAFERRRLHASSTPRRGCTCGRPRGEACWDTVAWLAELGILVAPGEFYGPGGARHVRVALTATDERVDAAVERLSRRPRALGVGYGRSSSSAGNGRGSAQSLACRAALRPPQSPVRGSASSAPVMLLRRNSSAGRPDSSAALTTVPSGQRDLGARGHVAAGLDDAVVAERDADAGVRADQAALGRSGRPPCRRRTASP